MLGLPIAEITIFAFVIALYLAATIVGVLQLPAGGEKYKRFLLPLVSLAVTLEAVMLIFRAVAIKAVPLTGLFESMIVLTIVFGLIYLFFSIAIQQVWFGSVMVWVVFGLIILAAIVAEPASEAHAAAATPWAIAHGITMILAGVATMLATASALLYLLGRRKLKQKKVMQVLGKVPNFEKLEHMNLLGLKACFVLLTFGLVSGIVMATVNSAALGIPAHAWLADSKIVLVIVVWTLIGIILALRHFIALKGKKVAYATLVVFFLILFAIVGTTVFCGTRHDFVKDSGQTVETIK
jgi:ABC-type uncharacterized transport system permease subunit